MLLYYSKQEKSKCYPYVIKLIYLIKKGTAENRSFQTVDKVG